MLTRSLAALILAALPLASSAQPGASVAVPSHSVLHEGDTTEIAGTRPVARPGGDLLVVSARQLKGRHALLVEGSAAPDAEVTLTLLASLAPDIPTSILQRSDVGTDANGRFAAVVSLAPDYWDGSMLTVVATSNGAQPATTHLLLNGGPQ